MKLVCLYYGRADMMAGFPTEKPVAIAIPEATKFGATAPPYVVGFPSNNRELIDYVGVYCLVSDDFEYKSVEIKEAPKSIASQVIELSPAETYPVEKGLFDKEYRPIGEKRDK